MAVFGISGSPIIDGNADRMTKAILDLSGKESKFVNLSTLKFFPCRGCAHNCAMTAMCGVKDALHPYLKDIRDAEALIIASPRHHGTMTAWTYSFFSRLWCFLHENHTLKGKPVVFISTGIKPIADGKETFRASTVKEHEFHVLGEIFYDSQTPPCFKCGKGDTCQWGGLWTMVGKDAKALSEFDITPDKFKRWEDDIDTVNEVKKYGEILSSI
jgi:multimeric flavodoxin WrbA